MLDFLNSFLPAIQNIHVWGYWAVLLVALLETTIGVGLLLPGSTIILFMGALAAKGYFDLGDLLWFAIIGAILGDNINYFIGKKYGSKIFAKGFWLFKPSYFKKGSDFFDYHGPKSILIGRFVPGLKEVVPLVAGVFGMKRTPFMIWNILGATGWGLLWILPGYFFAQSIDITKIWLTRAGFLLTLIFIVFLILYIAKVFLMKSGRQIFSFLFSVLCSIKRALMDNQKVQKLIKKHTLFFGFLKARLDKKQFWGLPATFLFLGFVYTFFLFLGIIEDVITADMIIGADTRIANLLAVFRNIGLTRFFLWITLLGKWQFVLGFVGAITGILWIQRKRLYIIPLILAVAGSELFTTLGKLAFHRPRPELASYIEQSFSFPSGHATIAVAFYGFLTYILIREAQKHKTKLNIFFGGIIIILLIGFSRLYLGVHYLSDVWGGYLIGALWLIIGISISEWLRSTHKNDTPLAPQTKMRTTTIILLFSSLVLYVVVAVNSYPQILQPARQQETVITQNINVTLRNENLRYTETLTGVRQEPLSFIIFAQDDTELIKSFVNSGWLLADKVSPSSVIKLAKTALLKTQYSNAPMTPSFWNKQPHNFGFEKPTPTNNSRQRHHARVWKTKYLTKSGKVIYVGVASLDSGIKWGIVHKISPDIDTEREILWNDMVSANIAVDFKKQQFVDPVLGQNFAGDQFFTNGQIYIISIK